MRHLVECCFSKLKQFRRVATRPQLPRVVTLAAMVLWFGSGNCPHGLERSSFHGNAEPLYLFVFAQFRTENRFTLFLELL